jgi:hypothetical protein
MVHKRELLSESGEISTSKYKEHLMKKLREMRDLEDDDTSRDTEIWADTPNEIFDTVLKFDGIIGYSTRIKGYIKDIYGVDLDALSTNIHSTDPGVAGLPQTFEGLLDKYFSWIGLPIERNNINSVEELIDLSLAAARDLNNHRVWEECFTLCKSIGSVLLAILCAKYNKTSLTPEEALSNYESIKDKVFVSGQMSIPIKMLQVGVKGTRDQASSALTSVRKIHKSVKAELSL